MRYFLMMAGLVLFLDACVPNRKHMYLQKNDLHAAVTTDKVVREHVLDTFNYRIQPNDIISVRFESLTPKNFDFLANQSTSQNPSIATGQGNPLMIGELVDESGSITLPALGQFQVVGLTVFELQEKLRVAVSRYVDSPIVRVRLLNYRVTILGEVTKEGSITLMNNRVSILEAIGLAGGLNEFANKSAIKLIRQQGTKAEVVYLNLLDENLVDSPYYYVHQNDVLIVPPLPNRPFRKYFSQNLSLFLSVVSITLLIVNLTR